MQTDFNVIVIGGGTAGCVLASRLSEDQGRMILLIEAGNSYPPDGYPKDLTNASNMAIEPPYNWGYQSVPGRTGHNIAVYAGRVLGGGSAINAGIARRARQVDFARWERHGLPEWSFAAALDAYKALENTPTGEDRWHGRFGPWPIRQSVMDDLTPPVRAFVQAAESAGFKRVDDWNGEHQGGIAPEVKNVVEGFRYNTGIVYLSADVRARPNLSIRSGLTVDRIGFDGCRATTVHLVNGETLRAGEIVVSAGVYGTPAILLRSGVGPAEHLRALDIPIVAALPVGERLQDQPMYTASYVVKPEAGATPPSGSGILWISSSEAIEGELDVHLSVTVQPDFSCNGARTRTLRVWASVVTPHSTGTVRLKSRDPQVTPRIDYNLLSEPSDRRRLCEIVKLARKIVQIEPVASLLDGELLPGPSVKTDAELDAALDAGLMTFYHGTSTAPMGGDLDQGAVTDAEGRVRGLTSLRVVDASIFPEAISVAINLTVLMVAERIASAMRHASLTANGSS